MIQTALEQCFQQIEEDYPELVKLRREMHMNPELSYHEHNTAQKIADYLTGLGLEVKTGVGGNGVVGKLRGGKPGKAVALRADFDALPIQDEKEVPWRSQVPGIMHACGHDAHTASLLGVARCLSAVKEQLSGNVVFLHQFAEEIPPGCLEGVDVVYGIHVSTLFPFGKIAVKEGDVMAASDAFEIVVHGKGGHGAHPDLAIDPVVVGSQIVLALQQIVSRRVDPQQAAVVTVAKFHSGTANNIIPSEARLAGTVRTFDPELRNRMGQWMEQIIQATCQAAGATCEFTLKRGYPAVKNHPVETKRVEKVVRERFGPEYLLEPKPTMGAEDFARYLQIKPGAFMFVGCANADIGADYPHHHPMFDIDERSIKVSAKLFVSLVFDALGEGRND